MPLRGNDRLKPRCYLCDTEIGETPHPFKIGMNEEYICEECYTKTVNRRRALQDEASKG